MADEKVSKPWKGVSQVSITGDNARDWTPEEVQAEIEKEERKHKIMLSVVPVAIVISLAICGKILGLY